MPEAALAAFAEAAEVMNVVAGGGEGTQSFTDLPSAVRACRAALAASSPALTGCADRYRTEVEEPYLAASSAYHRQQCAAVWPRPVDATTLPATEANQAVIDAIHRVYGMMREEEARARRYLHPRAADPTMRVLLQRMVGDGSPDVHTSKVSCLVTCACAWAPGPLEPAGFERLQPVRRLHELLYRLAGASLVRPS